MRLLQLVTGPDELLDLHPHVTIVQGLDDDRHEALVRAVVGLAHGKAVGEGLLESHGVLFALDDRHLAELDLDGLDIDPVVRRLDLPRAPGSVDARQLEEQRHAFEALLQRVAGHVEAQARARDALAEATAALERSRAAHAEAQHGAEAAHDPPEGSEGRVQAVEERLLGEWAELEAARSARAALERQVAQLEEAVQVAAARTAALVSRVDDLDGPPVGDQDLAPAVTDEDDPAPAGAPAPAGDIAPLVAAEEARLAELDRRLAVLDLHSSTPIEEAVRLVRAGAEPVPSAEARALADQIEALDAEVGDIAAAEASAAAIAAARTRLDDARQALLDAEAAARAPVLSRADVDELEQAHEAVQDAIERADGPFGGGRKQRRVEERRAAEQAILDRLGFRSYADYVMGSSTQHRDPQRETALRMAREELQEAEERWRDLRLDAEGELRRAELLDRRRELSDEARSLLGRTVPRAEEPEALRALRVPTVEVAAAAAAVRRALDDVGIDLGDDDLDPDELFLVAEAALDAALEGERRRFDLVEQRAAAAAALDDLRRSEAAPAPTPLAVAHHDLFSAGAEQVPAAERAALEDELAAARALEQAAAEAADRARADLVGAVATEGALADRVAASEAELEAATSSDLSAELAAADLGPAAEVAAHVAALAATVEAAEAAHHEAVARVEAEDRELAVLDEDGRALAAQIERLEEIVAAEAAGTATSADELEWYLLARLAGQRSVSVAGSLPLLLDDALADLDQDQITYLLDRLERMADAVQLIVVSDDPRLAAWVDAVGPARAAVVRPTAA